MSHVRARTSPVLILLSLCLVTLANLGVTVHDGHHSLTTTQGSTATLSLAGHTRPDSTLHMDSVSEVRTLSCPGCLLQHQIGNSYLPVVLTPERPSPTPSGVAVVVQPVFARALSTPANRGPPSC